MPNKNTTALLIFLLTIGFYIFTLSPSLAWGDGVRLQSEAISGESFILSEMSADEFSPDPFPFSKVGVTAWDHPLYIVMGYSLVKALPFVDSLWLVNLISAFFGAASVLLVFLLGYRSTGSIPASSYAALALAVSHTFWWHSSTPEVYTLFTFLLLLSIYFYEKFESTGRLPDLTISAFLLGMAMTDHILGVLAFPALLLYLLLSGGFQRLPWREWNRLVPPVMGFVIGFSLYILQFMRLSGNFQLGQIMGSAVGATFLNGLGGFSPIALGESLLTYLLFLIVQFGPAGVLLGAYGIRRMLGVSGSPSQKMVALYAVYTAFGIFYRVTDQFAFFLTSHVFFALLMGIGTQHLIASLRPGARSVLALVLVVTIGFTPLLYRSAPRLAQANGIDDAFLDIPQVGPGLRNGLAYYIDPHKRGDFEAYDFGVGTLTNLAPGSIVIAEWYTDTDEYFVLRHFHRVEGLRQDVTLLGWPTEDPFSFDPGLVLDVIDNSFPERPIYLASLSDRFYSSSRLVEEYCIVVESNLYRLYPAGTGSRECLEITAVTE